VYIVDATGELVSLPAEWTDVVAPDTFVTVSAGRSPFHPADLVELVRLVDELTARRSRAVKGTSP
jgi:hypothetical protein